MKGQRLSDHNADLAYEMTQEGFLPELRFLFSYQCRLGCEGGLLLGNPLGLNPGGLEFDHEFERLCRFGVEPVKHVAQHATIRRNPDRQTPTAA